MWRTILVTGFLDPSLAMLASLVMLITHPNDSHNSHSLVRYDRGHPLAFDDVRYHHSPVTKALSIQAIFSCCSIKPVRKSLVPMS
jgi:hypothetical protein